MNDLATIIRDPTALWTRRPPVDESILQHLAESCGFQLSSEYLSFLRCSNGGEGPMCLQPWWFQLWPAEDVLCNNRACSVAEFLPNFFGVGIGTGPELILIQKQGDHLCPVYIVPLSPMAESDVIQISYDFEMFVMALGRQPGIETQE